MSKKPLKRDELKRRMKKKERKEGSRLAHPERYLIICEGTKTEPNYFEGIKKRIENKYNRRMNDRINVTLTIEGTGRNTLSLLDYAKGIVKKEKKENREYEYIWLVYDLDDFPRDNFDNTAHSVKALNDNDNDFTKWHVAWSNQCIELWFLLHFNYYNSDIHRDMYKEKLNKIFKDNNLIEYKKNNKDIFEILIKYGNLDDAIDNAKRLSKETGGQPSSKMAPATKVYELVDMLKPHMF
ncbi:MAG: RloB domain-containing protein [Halanaerobiales bacterium]|nr:RloB domain-containing protein [Halanaerobiales bacterium]